MIQLKSNKVRWSVSAFFAVLILLGTYHSVFSLIAFLFMCLLLVFGDRESILQQLFFVLPMATIFKMSPDAQSFFTIILLMYVVWYFILPRKATLFIILFTIYIIVGQLFSGGFMLFRTIKLVCNILFLSSILNHKVQLNQKEIFFSYIIGNLTASCMGLIDSSVFRISSYIGVEEVGGIEFIDLTRFKGLYADPNYYTVGMIISLCLIVVMYHRKDIKNALAVVLSAPIIYFLVLTYSKSAILAMFFPLAFVVYSLLKQKKIGAVLLIVGAAIVLVVLAFDGKVEVLNVVISRFNAGETTDGTDLNSLTTGRFDLWILYIKTLLRSPLMSLFGVGVSSSILGDHAAHNTYLDLWYYLGAVGSGLFISALYLVLRQSKIAVFKRNLINYSVLISVLFLYFGLSELFYFDVPFHFFLAFTVLNLPINISGKNNENITDMRV